MVRVRHSKEEKIPLTRDKYEQLQKDFKRLDTEQKEILVRLQEAREMGDLSENGAYKYAKFELGNVRRKLREVRHLLRYGVIQEKSTNEAVDFGSVVTLKNDDREITFTLVSQHESDPAHKKLSTDSPIGQAVLGKKIGDTVVVHTPANKIEYTLIGID